MRKRSKLLFLALLPLLAISAPPAHAQWRADGAPICNAAGTQWRPTIVSDGSGGVIITWEDQRGPNYDIYAQHVFPSGLIDPAWPVNGRTVCSANGDQEFPTIIGDGAGGAIITWEDLRGFVSFDIYAQHVMANGTVDPAWPVNGRALCTAAGDQGFPQIVSDGAGGAIVTWTDPRLGVPNYDIYAQHVLASGAVDPAWPVDGRALCTAALDQEEPRIASDGAGGAIVTWYDFRDNTNYHIYAQRVLSSGAVDPAWPADGRAVCLAPLGQLKPEIIPAAGGVIIAWQDARNGVDYDIYAQHVLSTGVVDVAWPTNGRALCTATNQQQFPQLVSDGAGGAIVTWQDSRGVGWDVYAQHVKFTGAVDAAWPADGRGLCLAVSNQISPQIVSDGAGGALVTWQDQRSGAGNDVYTQHVLASGAVDPAWPGDGQAQCVAINDQDSPMIASDGSGVAIVTWYDARGNDSDIYASRVYASGGVAAVADGPGGTRLELLPPYPNPRRGGSVTISFDLPARARVSALVLDPAGRLVRTVTPEREFAAGRQTLEWDGRDESGGVVAPGVYLVSIRSAQGTLARRIAWTR